MLGNLDLVTRVTGYRALVLVADLLVAVGRAKLLTDADRAAAVAVTAAQTHGAHILALSARLVVGTAWSRWRSSAVSALRLEQMAGAVPGAAGEDERRLRAIVDSKAV